MIIRKKNDSADKEAENPQGAPIRKKKDPRPKAGGAGQLVTIQKSELDELAGRLAAAGAQIELYEFQIRNLRKDLEQIKLNSVLTNLGGPVIVSDKTDDSAPPAAVKAEVWAADEDSNYVHFEHGPEIPGMDEMLEWYESAPADAGEKAGVAPVAAAPAPAIIEGIDVHGMQQNMRACLDTIENLSAGGAGISEEINKRDVYIQLLKDKYELLQQQIDSDFVPRAEFRTMLDRTETLHRKVRDWEDELALRDAPRDDNVEPGQIEMLETRLKSLDDKFRDFENEKNELVAALEKEIDKQRETISSLEQMRSEEAGKNEIAADLEDKIKKQREAVESLEKTRAEEQKLVGEQIERHASRIRDDEEEKSKLQTKIEELSARLEEAEKAGLEQVESRERRIQELLAARELSENEKDELLNAEREKIEALETGNASLSRKIEELQKEIETYASRTSEIEERNARLDAEVSEKLGTHAEKILEMKNQYDALLEQKLGAENEAGRIQSDSEKQIAELHARISELDIEKQAVAREAEAALKLANEKHGREYQEMAAEVKDREAMAANLEKEIERLKTENVNQQKINFDLMSRLDAEKRRAKVTAAQEYPDLKRKLLEKFAAESSSAALLEMRRLFLENAKYDDAVRTFRQLLIEPGNQKFMPAVCLLVGEFYNLAGRTEEGAFYMANPLIKEDPFARQLLAAISAGQKQSP